MMPPDKHCPESVSRTAAERTRQILRLQEAVLLELKAKREAKNRKLRPSK